MKPTAEQIINWGREALNKTGALIPTEWNIELLEAICSAAHEAGRKDEREKVARWMIQRSYATGHGETTEDMLAELDWQIAENWNRAMINGIEAGRKDETLQRLNKAAEDNGEEL